jgi:hypothetical protein
LRPRRSGSLIASYAPKRFGIEPQARGGVYARSRPAVGIRSSIYRGRRRHVTGEELELAVETERPPERRFQDRFLRELNRRHAGEGFPNH